MISAVLESSAALVDTASGGLCIFRLLGAPSSLRCLSGALLLLRSGCSLTCRCVCCQADTLQPAPMQRLRCFMNCRDLKLDNTLLDDSNPPMLKLCDFGFAKTWDAEDANMYTHIGWVTDLVQLAPLSAAGS